MPKLQVHGLYFSQKDLCRTNGERGLGIKFPVVALGTEYKEKTSYILNNLYGKETCSRNEVTQKWQRQDDKDMYGHV